MYRLTAFRLVNWLHFTDVTRPVCGTTLLTGENGDGKSTVLDALQLALVADLRHVQFNKATEAGGGRGRRTLKGYCLWAEKQDGGDDGASRFRRQSATSYVLLQFEDMAHASPAAPASAQGDLLGGEAPDLVRPPRGARAPFVCGVAIEATARGGEPTRLHVVLPGATLAAFPPVPLVDPETRHALRLSDFEAYARRVPRGEATAAPDAYVDALRLQLGKLPRSLFPQLLVRGLAFKPMTDVGKFVTEFLLEPRPIAIDRLLSNLTHYQELRREAQQARVRLGALHALAGRVRERDDTRHAAELTQYVHLRAALAVAEDDEAFAASEAAAAAVAEDDARERARERGAAKKDARREVERLQDQLREDDVYRRRHSIDQELERLADEVTRADAAEEGVRRALVAQRAALAAAVGDDVPAEFRTGELRASAAESVIAADPSSPRAARLLALLDPAGPLEERDFDAWRPELSALISDTSAIGFAVATRQQELRAEGSRLHDAEVRLAGGRVAYTSEREAFRYALDRDLTERRVLLSRPVVPLCELVTAVEPEWQDAVEGWLGARSFDFIVDPADYAAVRDWYDAHRDACPAPDGRIVRLYGVSVVNMARVTAHGHSRAARPLSDVVTADDPFARRYLDMLLGEVERCDRVADLQRYRNAVTATGFLYRAHRLDRVRTAAAGQRHVLGAAARERERRRLADAAAAVAAQLVRLARVDDWHRRLRAAVHEADGAWARALGQLHHLARRREARGAQARLRVQRDAIDVSHLASLEASLRECRALEGAYEADEQAAIAEAEGEHVRADRAGRDAVKARDEIRARAYVLGEQFPDVATDPRWDAYRQRYADLFAAAADGATELVRGYERRAPQAHRRAQEAFAAFSKERAAYEERYGRLGANAELDAGAVQLEVDRWEQTRLPDYERQIAERVDGARVQLVDDVLAQLHSHFVDLRRTLVMLNGALRSCVFGKDRYEFTWTPAERLRPFHTLVTELAPRFELAGARAAAGGSAYELLAEDEPLRRRLDDLVEALTGRAESAEAQLQDIVDYRAYFAYDVRVTEEGTGKAYILSRNAGVASGGEVQTPTYAALFASLLQMYGGAGGGGMRCGLFLVDESFALLDDKRIPALMRFLDRVGLQGVLAMPTGREGHFAEHAQTILLVSREASGLGRVDDAHDLTRWLAAGAAP